MRAKALVAIAAIALLSTAELAVAQSQAASGRRPNVIVIMTDDVGYGDFGAFGAPDIKTPNIDSLARDGVKLTDFYAAPSCSPTRASFITGRYQQRVGVEQPLASDGPRQDGLRPMGYSLPQLLKKNGYATGLIGKWHLGWRPEFGPNAHGFDYFYGFLSGFIDFYTHVSPSGDHDLYENTTPVDADGHMTDVITERALRFIDEHAGEPFFLDVAYNAGHSPFQVPGRTGDQHGHGRHLQNDSTPPTRREYAAILEHADAGVGRILAKLAALNLVNDTVVIFTNDNGGTQISRNDPLSNRKGSVWEGGIRVPAVIRWPGQLPAGTTMSEPAIFMDLTASILAVTNTPVPAEARLEGRNLIPLLQGSSAAGERSLFFRSPTQKAVRRGDWKLLVDSSGKHLFNLRRDVGERVDLAREQGDLAQELDALIAKWEADVDAERKIVNPQSFTVPQGRGGRGGAAPANPE
jgi:arylsulfatase A-like enzyme